MTTETSSGGKPGRSGPPGNQNARKSGAYRAAGELKELVHLAMDGRTVEARAVADWIGDLAADLGGVENLSTQQRTIATMAGQTWLQIGRVDAFIARMPSIAHRKRRQLYPIVVQRQGLVNTLRQLLSDLGLERRAKDVGSLADYLREKAVNAQPAQASAATITNPTPLPESDEEQKP
jgi:hypothetical protein